MIVLNKGSKSGKVNEKINNGGCSFEIVLGVKSLEIYIKNIRG
jgi:hypothetical protein